MDKTQPINEEYKKFDTLEADIEMKRNGHGTERDKKEQKALFFTNNLHILKPMENL